VPYCGGPLHYATYMRKPRGGPPGLDEACLERMSLCCGAHGCRCRVLPPSVLFWGRRVYFAPAMLVITALRQGRDRGYTVEKLRNLFGATRTTLKRWARYFREVFPYNPSWKWLSGRLMPPVEAAQLPRSLIERFIHIRDGDPERGLISCLGAIVLGPWGNDY